MRKQKPRISFTKLKETTPLLSAGLKSPSHLIPFGELFQTLSKRIGLSGGETDVERASRIPDLGVHGGGEIRKTTRHARDTSDSRPQAQDFGSS
jgi:hypothetical protein